MRYAVLFLLIFAPVVEAQVKLPGLKSGATITRDERGIAHIEARSEEDLYYLQGYVTASDRLWQMDLHRRNARGQLAELFGSTVLEEDKRRRRLGYARIVEQSMKSLDPEYLRVLEAYARGVNDYIASLTPETLPVEFRLLQYRPALWQPADSIIVGKNLAEGLSTSWSQDVLRSTLLDLPAERLRALFPERSEYDVLVVGSDSKPASVNTRATVKVDLALLEAAARDIEAARASLERVGFYAEDLGASNNWVVNGRRTVTGKPILANDPHLRASAPSIWHMVHLQSGKLNVIGVTFPGAPGVILGHNSRIAWGSTNLTVDQQDVYEERFDPQNPRRYKTVDGWREAEVYTEEIKVRKSLLSPETETVKLEVRVTHHGPIFLEAGGKSYALKWNALDPTENVIGAFHKINRARNWREFRAALKLYSGPAQNFVYADVDGHIGYQAAGRVPLRSSGDGSVVQDGSRAEGEWTGWLAFERLPMVYDPASGVIVTANSRVVGTSYPHFLSRSWLEPFRSRRILNLIESKPLLSVDDMMWIQNDTRSFFAEVLLPELRRIDGHGALWREFIGHLEGWDCSVEPDERAPLVLQETLSVMEKKILTGALGEERASKYRWWMSTTFLWNALKARDKTWLPAGYSSYGDLIAASYQEARAELEKRYGRDPKGWVWGARYRVDFKHPLAQAPAIGKQFEVPHAPMRGTFGHLVTVNPGDIVSMRFVADLADWDSSLQGIALGVSGDPSSPHWSDQLEDWRKGITRRIHFTRRAVQSHAKSRTYLTPGR